MAENAGRAAVLEVPDQNLITVEHPCFLKSEEHAVAALGGENNVIKLVQPDNIDPARAYLRPNDLMGRALSSRKVDTDKNLLLKITVPKLVGRRRRRAVQPNSGASPQNAQPRSEIEKELDSTRILLQALHDNQKNNDVEVVAKLPTTHRFREMSDFQFSTYHTHFMTRLREGMLFSDYDTLRTFELSPNGDEQPPEEILPPPFFTKQELPYPYNYEQNLAAKIISEDAPPHEQVTKLFISIQSINIFTEEIPTQKDPGLMPENQLDAQTRDVIKRARKLLEERPIWTRRAMHNKLGIKANTDLAKRVHPYIGYAIRAGPWRDTIVCFGLNPATDPRYRIWQTLNFLSFSANTVLAMGGKRENLKQHEESHLFDGQKVTLDSKTWQVCDISDPLLRDLIIHGPYLDTCDPISGWYYNGTYAKIKVVMRHKIQAILEGAPLKDSSLGWVNQMPDMIEPGEDTDPLPGQTVQLVNRPSVSDESEAEAPDGAESDVEGSEYNQQSDASDSDEDSDSETERSKAAQTAPAGSSLEILMASQIRSIARADLKNAEYIRTGVRATRHRKKGPQRKNTGASSGAGNTPS